jgi:hypothetical protein
MRRDTTDQPGERCSLHLFVQTIPFLGRLVDMYPAKMHPRTVAPAMHKVETLHSMAAEGLAMRGWAWMEPNGKDEPPGANRLDPAYALAIPHTRRGGLKVKESVE